MASDSLRQIGKYIRKTGQDSDRSLKRAYPIQPRLERTRDVFDSTTEFVMQFDIAENDSRVLLDLFFTLPPPIRGCKAGCIFTKCEEFELTAGGHNVTLSHPYLGNSISAFVNGNVIPSSQVNEINPQSGEVFINANDGGTAAICYVYTECSESDPSFPTCPGLRPTIPSMSVLFSDRFDRTPSLTPYGGLGYWYTASFGDPYSTRIQLPYAGGAVSLSTVRNYMFENKRAAGGQNEIIAALDLSVMNSSLTITLTHTSAAPEPSIIITPTGQVTIFSIYEYITTTAVNYGSIHTVFQAPIVVTQPVYLRYLFDGVRYMVKMWPQNEMEPDDTTWMIHNPVLPTTFFGSPVESARITISDFVGATITCSGGYMTGIQHWGMTTGLFGLWNYSGEVGHSWTKDVCYDLAGAGIPPIPGSAFLGVCDPAHNVKSEFSTGVDNVLSINQHMKDTEPFYQYKYTWNQFFPDQAYFYGINQSVVSFTDDLGKGTTAKVSGQVKWFVNGTTEFRPSTMTIALMAFNYADGSPPENPLYFAGSSISTITSGHDTWTNFELEIPILNGHIQWGVRFIDEPVALADQLGDHQGTLFLPRTAEIMTDFRKLVVEAVMAPAGNGLPFCPNGGLLGSRCNALAESFNGPTFDFSCSDQSVSYYGSTGQEFVAFADYGARLELNGSARVSFRANGITTDGSDGRCPYDSGSGYFTASGTSRTFSAGGVRTSFAPATCGDNTLSLKFRFGNVGEPWVSLGGETFYPYGTLNMAASSGGSYFFISTSSEPSDNIIFMGNVTLPNNLLPNIWYEVYIESSDILRGKIWRVGDTMPDDWLVEVPSTVRLSGLTIGETYNSYSDDNFYMEVSDVVSNSIEPGIVPGTPPPPAPNPPPPPPPPTEPPPPSGGGGTANVSTIAQLKSALLDNANTEIVVQNGTYTVTGASGQGTNALYIGGAYASRANHVLVRPQTPGGVTFSGGGALMGPLLMFQNGARFQTWDGFHFANAILNETGTVIFGGDSTYAPPHDITLKNTTFESTLRRNASSDINAHGIYFAHASGRGPYNILVENTYVDGSDTMCLWAAIHGFHGDASHPPADSITIRNTTVVGTFFPFVIWFNESGAQTNNWLIDTATISNARSYAFRFESTSAHNFVIKNVTSTGSGLGGFYSSLGTYPNIPGVTFINNSFG